VIELARYVLEKLRKDEEFILYRGQSKDNAARVLVLSPVLERPALESLKRLEHEFSLKEELDPAWAVRPRVMARHWDRMVPRSGTVAGGTEQLIERNTARILQDREVRPVQA
jgi:hypothetical protein